MRDPTLQGSALRADDGFGWYPSSAEVLARVEADAGTGKGPCVLWGGARTSQGYGVCNGRLAHRVAYELATGHTLTRDVHLHHRCAAKACMTCRHLVELSPTQHGRVHAASARRAAAASLEARLRRKRQPGVSLGDVFEV